MFLHLELTENKTDSAQSGKATRIVCAISTVALFGVTVFSLLDAGREAPQIASLVAQNLFQSGVENPVTAVLLNFRSYDTLLEVGVLVIVAAAMLPARVGASSARLLSEHRENIIDPVFAGLLRWLVPLAIIVGGYLLWTGAYAPGGAFQAGAMIAGAGVALSLTERYEFAWSSVAARTLLGAGLAVFILVGGLCGFITGAYLQYPQAVAGLLILVIELAATASIAAVLLLLFTSLRSSQVSHSITAGHSSAK